VYGNVLEGLVGIFERHSAGRKWADVALEISPAHHQPLAQPRLLLLLVAHEAQLKQARVSDYVGFRAAPH
jgi:hypothetical protein